MSTSSSTLGPKLGMAVTGLLLLGWSALHAFGNLLALGGPELINRYADALHGSPVLWLQRAVVVGLFALHIRWAWVLFRRSRAATAGYRRQLPPRTRGARALSRTMRLTGVALLVLTAWHVAHIYGVGHPDYVPGDVHHNLVAALSTPLSVGLYALLAALLGFHVAHGLGSALVTLGFSEVGWPPLVRQVARVAPAALAGGFALVVVWMA